MSWNTAVLGYQWSDDNQAEVDKGWIVQADSIEALAQRIGRDPERLRQTVDRYNDLAANRHDADYERSAATLVPLQGPPFYAIAIVPTIVCTGGGAKRTKESEVIDTAGNPIKRLYSAGELGSMYSDLYQDGSYLMEAMISGRVAGANTARLSPWDK
jgi:succinate dehydrogenase/fumarate reductase flavoprotein subunit